MTPRRRSHRASGPVDATPTPKSSVDIAASPRRRARLRQQAAEQAAEYASQRAANLALPPQQTPAQPASISPTIPQTPASENSQNLFAQWLHDNGFDDLREFQRLTSKHDFTSENVPSQELQGTEKNAAPAAPAAGYQSVDAPTAVPVSPPTSASATREATFAPSPSAPAETESSRPTQPSGQAEAFEDSLTRPSPSLEPVGVEPGITTSGSIPSVKQFSPRRAAKREHLLRMPHLPEPLAKNRRVPVLLTLGVFVLILVALSAVILWYRANLVNPDADKHKIEVLGAIGAQPVLSLSSPISLADSSSEILIRGKGQPLSPGDTAALRITVFSGRDGKLLSSKNEDAVLFGKLSASVFGSELYETVKGAREGTRFIIKHPVERAGNSAMEIGVVDVIPTRLQGAMTPPPADFGLQIQDVNGEPIPQIVGDFGGDLRSHVLFAGTGATVGVGQTALVRYREYSFSSPPALLNDHWGEPVKLKLNDKIQQGVSRGLVDQKVGSRVLLVVPPAEGSGSKATILLIDILASWTKTDVAKTL